MDALMQYRRFLASLVLPLVSFATSIVQVSLEDAVHQAVWIVSGDVVRNWCAWDSGHRFIWTHTEIAVREQWKGEAASTVTVSEPGGIVDGKGMAIAGMVRYVPGEHVVVFLYRTKIGFIRTVGLAQGKLLIDRADVVHPGPVGALTVSPIGAKPAGTSIGELEGHSLSAVRARITSTAATPAAQEKGSR
jgi:hypothetical protein